MVRRSDNVGSMFSSATSKASPNRRPALSPQGTKKRKIDCLPAAVNGESDGITWDISTHIPQARNHPGCAIGEPDLPSGSGNWSMKCPCMACRKK